MEGEGSNDVSVVGSFRKKSISRRGGVRTRGGRLPPINLRDFPGLAQATATASSKKVLAPKIPQRRIKKEIVEKATALVKREPIERERTESRRGRGRGTKVFVQTEGSFLSQGPAAKAKKEHISDPCASIGRTRTREKIDVSKIKMDPGVIDDLLNGHNDGVYEDEFGIVPPIRLPLVKDGIMVNMKNEKVEHGTFPDAKDEVKVKVEPGLETEGDDENKRNFATKLDEVRNHFEEFCRVKDEGMLILLHWPNCFPKKSGEEEKTGVKKAQVEVSEEPSLVDKLPEGRIGKLQFLKSGQKRLILGPLVFSFEDGTVSETPREVVSIRTDNSSGDLAIIGRIDRTMVLRPVVENMLNI